MTDSPRATPRRDAQLPDAAFCCATRIMYLGKRKWFGRQSRRSLRAREGVFAKKIEPRRRDRELIPSRSRAVGLAIIAWVLGFDRRGARPFDARVPFDLGRGGLDGHARPPGVVHHALYALFVLALLVHVPLVLAPPREEVVRLPAIVERDQEVRAEVPVREVHLRITQLLLRGVHGGTHRNEEDARCVHSRVAM